MTPFIIDSHTHIYGHEFFAPEEAHGLLKKCFAKGVKKLVLIGTCPDDSLEACRYAKKWNDFHRESGEDLPELFWTWGIHPEFAGKAYEKPDFSAPEFLGVRPVAIGEVGLDFHDPDGSPDRAAQEKLFREMIELAVENDLPLSLHIRSAIPEALRIMDEYTDDRLTARGYHLNDDPTENGRSRLRAVVHSFSDSKQNLKRCLARGFYIGVNGIATFATIPTPPLSRIMLETDSPFLMPAPFHIHRADYGPDADGLPPYGPVRNDSSFVPLVAEWLAGRLGVSGSEVAAATTQNTEHLFGLEC